MNWNNSRTGCAVTECHTAAESEQQPEAWINPRDGSVMRLISAGEFIMGSTLDQIEAAIQRTEDGSFGRCEECGVKIPKPRLEALPDAAQCIRCASQREEGAG